MKKRSSKDGMDYFLVFVAIALERFSQTIGGFLSLAEDIGHSLLRMQRIEPRSRQD